MVEMLWLHRGHDLILGKHRIIDLCELHGEPEAGLESLGDLDEFGLTFDRLESKS